jgi:iron complex transport system substrate-binding protein
MTRQTATRWRPRLRLGALAALIVVACAGAVSPQATPPRRIISLVPAVTEMLFALGAGNEVIAVSTYDKFPPEAATRPKVGALVDPDFERILSLRPDLVMVYESQTEFIGRLERVKIPVFHYRHAGLADVTETIRAVGARIGRASEAGATVVRIERDLERVRQQVAGRPRPRTAVVFGREPGTLRSLFASAGIGFIHDLLVTAGGADVFDDVKRQSLQVSTEILLARKPEVILDVHGADVLPADRLAREREVWRALPSLPAVRTGRVSVIADDRLVVPGPRVAEAARLIAQILHPGAVK